MDSPKRTLTENRTFAEGLIENTRDSILVPDESPRATLAHPAFYQSF